jgi:hypothetical protein
MDASGSIPLPPIPLKKTGESIMCAALFAAGQLGQNSRGIEDDRRTMFANAVTAAEMQPLQPVSSSARVRRFGTGDV